MIRTHAAGLYQACWSDAILKEASGGITDSPVLRLKSVFPECTYALDQYESLATPHGDEEHAGLVPALCTRAHAQVIVAMQPDQFPESTLKPLDLEAQHPDEFLCYLLEAFPNIMLEQVIIQLAADTRDPPRTVVQILKLLGEITPNFVGGVLDLLPPDMQSPG